MNAETKFTAETGEGLAGLFVQEEGSAAGMFLFLLSNILFL